MVMDDGDYDGDADLIAGHDDADLTGSDDRSHTVNDHIDTDADNSSAFENDSLDSMIRSFRSRASESRDTARRATAQPASPPRSVTPARSPHLSPRLRARTPVTAQNRTRSPPHRVFIAAPPRPSPTLFPTTRKQSISTRPTRGGGRGGIQPPSRRAPSASESAVLATQERVQQQRQQLQQRQQATSTPQTRSNLRGRRQQQQLQQQTHTQRAASDESDRDGDAAVRPLPKLTQRPTSKPSLVLVPRSRLLEIPPPPLRSALSQSRLQHPPLRLHSQSRPTNPPATKAKAKATTIGKRTPTSTVLSPVQSLSPLPSLSLSSLSLSPTPNDAVDDQANARTPGDESIDHLIDSDIDELRWLISSARSGRTAVTSKPITFAAPAPASRLAAPLRAQSRGRNPHRQGHQTRVRSSTDSTSPPPPPPPLSDGDDNEGDDSFDWEFHRLRATARSLRAANAVADSSSSNRNNKEPTTAEAADDASDSAANIRKVSHAIDEALLLALQPLERRRQALDQQDATDTAADTDPAASADTASSNTALAIGLTTGQLLPSASSALPLAAQAIVEHLDVAFAAMNEQRSTELRAVKEAQEVAQAAVDSAKQAASDKRQAEARAAKQRYDEVLRLLPLRGRLLTTDTDVDAALRRLEHAEAHASDIVRLIGGRTDALLNSTGERIVHHQANDSAGSTEQLLHTTTTTSVANELMRLEQYTRQRMQALEQQLERPSSFKAPVYCNNNDGDDNEQQQATRRVDWQRSAFESGNDYCSDASGYRRAVSPAVGGRMKATAIENDDSEEGDLLNDANTVDSSFRDVVQQHVVEQLDLTMLKLRHVLQIDAKDTAEAADKRARDLAATHQQEREAVAAGLREQEALAAAQEARRRVMGLSSLMQLRSWAIDASEYDDDDDANGDALVDSAHYNDAYGERDDSDRGNDADSNTTTKRGQRRDRLNRPDEASRVTDTSRKLEAINDQTHMHPVSPIGRSRSRTLDAVSGARTTRAVSTPVAFDVQQARSRFEALQTTQQGVQGAINRNVTRQEQREPHRAHSHARKLQHRRASLTASAIESSESNTSSDAGGDNRYDDLNREEIGHNNNNSNSASGQERLRHVRFARSTGSNSSSNESDAEHELWYTRESTLRRPPNSAILQCRDARGHQRDAKQMQRPKPHRQSNQRHAHHASNQQRHTSRKSSGRSNRSDKSHATMIALVQQQIAHLQADRREKRAWVSAARLPLEFR